MPPLGVVWPLRAIAAVAYTSLGGIAVANAAVLQGDAGSSIPVSIVPTVSLIAVIGAAVTVGAVFQRVRDLERRMRDLELNTERRHRRDSTGDA